MTVDVATLGIAVTSNADVAAADLDKLANSGDKAEVSTKGASSASRALASALTEAIGALRDNTAAAQANTTALSGNVSAAKDAASAEAALAAAHDKGAMAAARKAKEADDLAAAEDRLAAAERSAAGATASLGDAIAQATGRMSALKASADPIAFAIDKVNAELMENEALLRSGSLSQAQYMQNQAGLTNRLEDLTKKQAAYNATLANHGRAARLSTTEALNFSRQIADVGVTAAMGMNPLMIAIQQGPQIADIMKTSGLGIGGMAKELGIMLGILKVVNVEQGAQVAGNVAVATSATAAATAESALAVASGRAAGGAGAATAAAGAQVAANGAVAASATAAGAASTAAAAATSVALAPVAFVILGVVAALGVLTAGWALATRAANKEIGKNIDHLKLSEDQLKKLKKEGVDTGVTMGDTFRGLGTTIKELFFEQFGDQVDWLAKKWDEGLDWITRTAVDTTKKVGGFFVGTFYAIKATWSLLPAAIGDAAVSAANLAIRALEGLVNKGIEGLNKVIAGAKALAAVNPAFAAANLLGTIDNVSFGQLDNANAGAMARVGQVGGEAFNEGYGVYGEAVDTGIDRLSRNTRASRDARVRKAAGEADEPRNGRKAGLSDEEKELQRATKAAEEYIKNMKEETAQIGKNTIERHRYAVSVAEAAAPTEALKTQIREVGKAWEDATIAEAQSQLVKALKEQNAEIAHENSLQGMNAREREVANAQREISIRLAEMEADGIPTTTAAIKEQTDAIIRNAEVRGQLKLDAENAREFADAMGAVADRVGDAADGLRGLFGTAGDALANVMDQYAEYESFVADTMARVKETEAQYGYDSIEANRERQRSTEELAQAQVNHYGDMLGAAKGFFQQNSTGYKVMEAAERAYRLYQFAMAVKAMFFDTAETTSAVANAGVRMSVDAAETTSSVAKSGIRAAADGVAAFAKTLASLPFPFNLAAGAVVLAALVGVGVAMTGKGGKGGGGGATASAGVPVEETPTSYTPFLSHDRPAAGVGSANDNRISPPEYSPLAAGLANGGSKQTVFDFSGSDFSGSDPEAVKQAVQSGIEQARPDILADAREQTYEDFQNANRQKLGG